MIDRFGKILDKKNSAIVFGAIAAFLLSAESNNPYMTSPPAQGQSIINDVAAEFRH